MASLLIGSLMFLLAVVLLLAAYLILQDSRKATAEKVEWLNFNYIARSYVNLTTYGYKAE